LKAEFQWTWLGRVPYGRAWELQEALRRRILEEEWPDCLLLLEHDPVVTIGRHGSKSNILLPREELSLRGVEVVESSRGGDVTYHGPGQLVGYPVFRVPKGPRAHVRMIGEALRRVCAEAGVAAEWTEDPLGLWVGRDKIAAFGLHVSRGVAIHGFALNVTTALEAFDWIVPCGLRARGVTSLKRLVGDRFSPEGIAPRVARVLAEVSGRVAVQVEPACVWSAL